MHHELIAIIDALDDVKLLPHREPETDVVYGYVAATGLTGVVGKIVQALYDRGYEVHRCEWPDEIVILALNHTPRPFALRITASAEERYNLYTLSRPQTPQALWQWAQAMMRQHVRERRDSRL